MLPLYFVWVSWTPKRERKHGCRLHFVFNPKLETTLLFLTTRLQRGLWFKASALRLNPPTTVAIHFKLLFDLLRTSTRYVRNRQDKGICDHEALVQTHVSMWTSCKRALGIVRWFVSPSQNAASVQIKVRLKLDHHMNDVITSMTSPTRHCSTKCSGASCVTTQPILFP